jgi:DNA-binding NarL/FixJ family response regulator
MKPIRILLADDHTVVRKGLRLLLESQQGFEVIADASDGRETVAMAEQHQPDVVVMDVAMPILNGIEAARQISAKLPRTAIVFLSMHSDEGYVLKALKSGARAYLLKDSAEYDLISAIKAVNEARHSSAQRSAKCSSKITCGRCGKGTWRTAMSCSQRASAKSSNCLPKGKTTRKSQAC